MIRVDATATVSSAPSSDDSSKSIRACLESLMSKMGFSRVDKTTSGNWGWFSDGVFGLSGYYDLKLTFPNNSFSSQNEDIFGTYYNVSTHPSITKTGLGTSDSPYIYTCTMYIYYSKSTNYLCMSTNVLADSYSPMLLKCSEGLYSPFPYNDKYTFIQSDTTSNTSDRLFINVNSYDNTSNLACSVIPIFLCKTASNEVAQKLDYDCYICSSVNLTASDLVTVNGKQYQVHYPSHILFPYITA